MSNKVSLEDAVMTVNSLDEILLPDNQPCIEAFNGTILYQSNLDTNFEDKNAFVTGISKYIEEAHMHAQLNTLLEKGNQHAIMLYTWRCCSRAIPQVKSNDQVDRIDIYERTVEVLGPHVNKLTELMKFQAEAIEAFCKEIKRLCHPKKEREFVSEAYLLTLGKFINMFAVLDELKNMKSSVKNDHSAYRRAAQFRKSDAQSVGLESQNLSIFLATNDIIRTNLKKALDDTDNKVHGYYEEILADVINTSVEMFENQLYLLPQEKHILVKVIGFSLILLDGENFNINKLDAKKRINLSKIDKIFRQYKVVPLYGDMQITPFSYVMKTKNYDESKWPLCNAQTDSQQGKILEQIDRIRNEHTHFISELAKYSNEIAISKESKRSDEECKSLYNLALNGLKYLSKWTNIVLELYNWKLLHPCDPKTCPKESEDYERATKHNYNAQEKYAIVEIISMIKGLQTLMFRLENVFKEAINQTTYFELQNFVQNDLRDVIRKTISKKKDLIKSILLAVRETCVDWFRGKEPDDDPAMKGKKDPESGYKIERPSRCIGPSSTQLYMVRTMLESLVCDRTSKNKKSLRKELDQNHIDLIEKFHKDSFFWDYMLNFSDSLQKCCDLSQMWYREFFLEMTMGKKIQFPIEMSMPWILTNHVLEANDQAMIEYVFYTLDLYNDAAMNALAVFRKRHLYDEVEAEVNLCFDQFVYKLSEQIFRAYKQTAAGILLDKKFRDDFNKIQLSASVQLTMSPNGTSINNSTSTPTTNNGQTSTPQPTSSHPTATHRIQIPNTSRYEILLKQRHIQLLGRSINLSRLITQRVTLMIQNNLRIAISKFESSNLTGIIELDSLIQIHQMTHKLLSKHLVLPDFDELFKEADLNVTSSYGRIALHILAEICSDVLPNYCYNGSTNRFVITSFRITNPIQRDQAPSYQAQDLWGSKAIHIAYHAINSLYTGFIGQQHIRCINRYLGYQGIALIINEFLQLIQSVIQNSLTNQFSELYGNLRKNIQMPLFQYGSPGILTFYYEHLSNIIKYGQLRTSTFPQLRQIGNAIIFSLLMEQALSIDEVCDLVHASIFLNWLPKPYCKENESIEAKMKKLEAKYSTLQVVKIIDQLGTDEQRSLAHEGELLTRERLCCGLSIFEYVLTKIKTFLTHEVWNGGLPIDPNSQQYVCNNKYNENLYTNERAQFYRLWSAIQFVYCLPKQTNDAFLVEEEFGDALIWAGCTFVALLNQQHRFETFDHCYHLLKAHQIDNKTGIVSNIQLENFINRIRKHQILNQDIFSILNRYLRSSTNTENMDNNGVNGTQSSTTSTTSTPSATNVICFHPPTDHKTIT